MKSKTNLKDEILELVSSGNYNLVQQINDGPEEPYEGCIHNLYMILEDDMPTVRLLDPSDPQAREDSKTYKIEFESFYGDCAIILWEI